MSLSPNGMSDAQKILRWQLRYDFLEDWLAESISHSSKLSKETALVLIRQECEEEFRRRGLGYPFKENNV